MRELREQYEALVEQEDELLLRIRTCELYLQTLLETMYRKDREMDLETVKEIAARIHLYADERRSELWHVRMEKTILAVQLKPES